MSQDRVRCRYISGLLDAFLEHELPEAEAARVRNHLERCPVCRADAQKMTRALGALHELSPAAMPEAVRAGLHARIAMMDRRPAVPIRQLRFAGSAAALLLAISSAAYLATRPVADDTQKPLVETKREAVFMPERGPQPGQVHAAPDDGGGAARLPAVAAETTPAEIGGTRRRSSRKNTTVPPVPESILDVADERGVTARMLINARAAHDHDALVRSAPSAMALPSALGEPHSGEWRDHVRIGDQVTELRGKAERDASGRLRAIRVSATTAGMPQLEIEDDNAGMPTPNAGEGPVELPRADGIER